MTWLKIPINQLTHSSVFAVTHYSLLNILDTDYDNHLVLAHCRSKAIGTALFCSSFNLFLLKRQVPPLSENAARIFNTLTTRARLREACSGQVQLVSTQNNDPGKFSSALLDLDW